MAKELSERRRRMVGPARIEPVVLPPLRPPTAAPGRGPAVTDWTTSEDPHLRALRAMALHRVSSGDYQGACELYERIHRAFDGSVLGCRSRVDAASA